MIFAARLSGISTAILGALVLLGWALDVATLKSVFPGLIAMQPATALCFIGLGAALALRTQTQVPQAVSVVFALLATTLAGQSLFQDATGLDLGTDHLFFATAVRSSQVGFHPTPGRMAVAAALGLVALGAAITAIPVARSRARATLLSTLATAVLLMSLVSLLGYAAGLWRVYAVSMPNLPALHTATGLGLLAAGTLALRADFNWVGRLARANVTVWVAVVLLASAALALALGVDAAIRAVTQGQAASERTRRVQAVVLTLVDAETGQRGFLLTGEERYLAPYNAAQARITAELDTTEAGLRGDQEARDRFARIRLMAADKLTELAETLTLYRTGDVEGALAMVRTGRGRSTMNAIRMEATALGQLTKAAEGDTLRGMGLAAAGTIGFATLAVILILRGVAQQRRGAEEIRRANETFVALVEASPVAIVSVDPELRVLTWNPAAEQIFNLAATDMLGHDIDIESEGGGTDIKQLCQQLLEGKAVRNILVACKRRDGAVRRIRISGAALFDQNGRPRQIVLVLEDVTEPQAVEEQLRQAQKMEAIGNLTGGLAHDFNNLLGVIIGNLDLLHERIEDEPVAAEILGEALAAAVRGADLNRRLLAFARRQPLHVRRIFVNDVVEGAAKLLSRTLGGAIEIRLAMDPILGAVEADPAQLEAALTNLAVNARDAMPRGGRLTIATRHAILDAAYAAAHSEVTPGDYVLVEVSDSGEGMSPATVAKAFEPFFTTKKLGSGTGLGLSMVFGFAKQSGGHLKIYSEVGHGTTVRLYLPLAPVEPIALQTAPVEVPPLPLGQETVLAVEDDAALRRVLVRHLEALGYTVVEAANGQQALAVLSDTETDTSIDLLLTDIVMPGGLNGWELAGKATQLRPTLKVLFTSGFPDGAFGPNGKVPEGAVLLGKPYRKEELAQKLRVALAV